jgi:hypothetical protein
MNIAKALKELSEPHSREEKMITIIERSAHLAGLSYSRAYEIWYGRARRVEPAEVTRISEALDRKHQRDARNEIQELRLRIAKLEQYFLQTDETFHREDLNALGEILRSLERGLPRPR